jgi:DNA polymerase-4
MIVDTALAVFDQFELDRPIRLLGVRLELAMPQSAVTAGA